MSTPMRGTITMIKRDSKNHWTSTTVRGATLKMQSTIRPSALGKTWTARCEILQHWLVQNPLGTAMTAENDLTIYIYSYSFIPLVPILRFDPKWIKRVQLQRILSVSFRLRPSGKNPSLESLSQYTPDPSRSRFVEGGKFILVCWLTWFLYVFCWGWFPVSQWQIH